MEDYYRNAIRIARAAAERNGTDFDALSHEEWVKYVMAGEAAWRQHSEINFAVHDAQLRDSPTLDQCRMQGQAAKAYGWSCTPWGHWTDEQKAAYRQGYDNKSQNESRN